MDQKNKFKVQDNQYTFPYHHISALDENCYPLRHRLDSPAFGYLCYIYHIKEMVEKSNPTSVLDVGCGDGRFISELSDDIEKVGCDLSYRAIQFAKGFNPQFTYYNEDVNNLNSVFDVVTCIETLEHVPDCDVDSFINDLANKTKKSGKVIISVPTTVVPLKNKHYRHYNIGTFNNELESSKAPLQIKKYQYISKDSLLHKMVDKIIASPHVNKKYIKIMKRLDVTYNKNGKDAIFFWIPKTAGTSIYDVLSNHGCHKIKKSQHFHKFDNGGIVTFGHVNVLTLLENHIISPDFFSKSFKFAFVRNPWDRLVSLYFYFLKTGKLSKKYSFTKFVEYIYLNGIDPIGIYNVKGFSQCQPQVEWITNDKDEIIVDFVGKFENLDEDFDKIKHYLGVKGELPVKNRTSHKHYRKYYNNETKKIVELIYKKDIEYFNYHF